MRDDLGKETPDEKLYRARPLAKMLVGLLPGGGTAAELFDLIVADPATKRRDRFVQELAADLDSLAAKNLISLQDLTGEGEASALLAHAIHASLKAEGKLKLDALRNAAVNGALHQPDEREFSHVILGLIDRLSGAHISMLKSIYHMPEHRTGLATACMLGVGFMPNSDGMKRPKKTLPLEDGDPQFYDVHLSQLNRLIINTLISDGLLVLNLSEIKPVTEWSTDPEKNGTDIVAVTQLGEAVLEEITSPDALQVDAP